MTDLTVRPSYVYQQYRKQQWVQDLFKLLDEYKQEEYYEKIASFISSRDIIHANSEYLTFYTYNLLGLYRPLGSTAVTNYYDIGFIYDGSGRAKTREELFKAAGEIVDKYKNSFLSILNMFKKANDLEGWFHDLRNELEMLKSNILYKGQTLDTEVTEDEIKNSLGAYYDTFKKYEKVYSWAGPYTYNKLVDDNKDLENDFKKAKKDLEDKYPLLSYEAVEAGKLSNPSTSTGSLDTDGSLYGWRYNVYKYPELYRDPFKFHTQWLAFTFLYTEGVKWHSGDAKNPPPYDYIFSKIISNNSPFNNVLDRDFVYDDSQVYDGTIPQAKFLLYLSYIYNYNYEISNLHYIVSFISKWCEIEISEVKITVETERINLVLPSTDATTEFVRLTVNYGDVLGFPKGPFLDIRIEKTGVTI